MCDPSVSADTDKQMHGRVEKHTDSQLPLSRSVSRSQTYTVSVSQCLLGVDVISAFLAKGNRCCIYVQCVSTTVIIGDAMENGRKWLK